MIILGIDPGLAIAGYAVLEHLPPRMRLIDCGTINTKAGLPLPERLSISVSYTHLTLPTKA